MLRTLPDFGKPPLVEVALSVQFEPLEKLHAAQLGLLWSDFRKRFPLTEERVPLEPVIERFGIRRAGASELRLQMVEMPPVPRVWFLNEAGTELIQIQQDRFIHNWRKVGDSDSYPRYESLRENFRAELEKFQDVLTREQCGSLLPNQCEVTYVNQIVAGDGWNNHGELGKVLNLFQSGPLEQQSLETEDARLAVRFVLRNERNEPIGRLHLSVQPGFRRADDQPLFDLTLTARSQPAGERFEDVLHCLDQGREAIVKMFAFVTTSEMHKIWERKDA